MMPDMISKRSEMLEFLKVSEKAIKVDLNSSTYLAHFSWKIYANFQSQRWLSVPAVCPQKHTAAYREKCISQRK